LEVFDDPSQLPRIVLEEPPNHWRLWFISEDRNRLIQFQDNALYFNWRQDGNQPEYLGFDNMIAKFSDYLQKLSEFFASIDASLDIKQAELSYINAIPIERHIEIGQWINITLFDSLESANLSLGIMQTLKRDNAVPYANLYSSIVTAKHRETGKPVIQVNFTSRGQPGSSDIIAALEFLQDAHDKIHERFLATITSHARKQWNLNNV
jgi:uncharacterized protein (TIGR04255 family)